MGQHGRHPSVAAFIIVRFCILALAVFADRSYRPSRESIRKSDRTSPFTGVHSALPSLVATASKSPKTSTSDPKSAAKESVKDALKSSKDAKSAIPAAVKSTAAIAAAAKDETKAAVGEQLNEAAQAVKPVVTKKKTTEHAHKMSMTSLVINIVADLCPHGMLPLAYGLSKGGPSGLVPAFALILLFGAMSMYTMTKYADLASRYGGKTIGEVWSKLISIDSEWIVDLSVFSLCFGCCVFYSAFIGDIFSALITAVGVTHEVLSKRWVVLSAISALVLAPLCQLEDLSALGFSSILGVVGIVYTVVFHAYRLKEGSYSPGGALSAFVAEKYQPKWPTPKFTLWTVNKGTLMLANMLCVAFLAHYNAINYYSELENNTPPRYKQAILSGFGTALAVFSGMMIVGYSLFGSASQPLLLNNFARTQDLLATFARLATGLAIVFAYPLMFAGLKSSMFEIIFNPHKKDRREKPPSTLDRIVRFLSEVRRGKHDSESSAQAAMKRVYKTLCIVGVMLIITGIAIVCGEEDVDKVLGIVGSVLGCFVAYIMPALLSKADIRKRLAAKQVVSVHEQAISSILIAVGSMFGGLGVWITLSNSDSHH